MALKLVLEPLFEADFQSCSYGFRPNRSAHDAIAEIRHYGKAHIKYEWVVEGDIRACFDRIDHGLLLANVRKRVGDRKVLSLIRAFLEAGILRGRNVEATVEGHAAGRGSLAAFGEHSPERVGSSVLGTVSSQDADRAQGGPQARFAVWRLVRYADDFVVLIFGSRDDALAERIPRTPTTRERLRFRDPPRPIDTHPTGHHDRPLPNRFQRLR
jgi:RNA-directed DNA polymerase